MTDDLEENKNKNRDRIFLTFTLELHCKSLRCKMSPVCVSPARVGNKQAAPASGLVTG